MGGIGGGREVVEEWEDCLITGEGGVGVKEAGKGWEVCLLTGKGGFGMKGR